MTLFDLDADPTASEPTERRIGPVRAGTALLVILGVVLAAELGSRAIAPAESRVEQRLVSTEGPWRDLAAVPGGTSGLAAGTVNGYVYVLNAVERQPSTSLRRYDPARDVWEDGPPLPAHVRDAQVVGVGGDLLVFGGNGFAGPSTRGYRYETKTSSWGELARLPEARAAGGAAVVDGVVYLVGGANALGVVQRTWAFDPGRELWREIAALPTPRSHLAVATYSGMVCAAGGFSSVVTATLAFECYQPYRNAWVTMPQLPVALAQAAAAAANGAFWLVGEETFVFKDGWTAAPGLRQPRVGPALATTADRLLAIGGGRRGIGATGVVEAFTLR